MLLYPQLPHPTSVQLLEQLHAVSVRQAAAAATAGHEEVLYTPSGGTRVSPEYLAEIRTSLLQAAKANGYPEASSSTQLARFDYAASLDLYTRMKIPAGEAALPGVWEFFTCVLLPDVVRWRFPGGANGTANERFLAGRRNTFQRLWWRALFFGDAGSGPQDLLEKLGEDEIVQVMERPSLAGMNNLSIAIGAELLRAAGRHPSLTRRTLIREVQKRVLRLASLVSFESLEPEKLASLVGGLYDDVATALSEVGERGQ